MRSFLNCMILTVPLLAGCDQVSSMLGEDNSTTPQQEVVAETPPETNELAIAVEAPAMYKVNLDMSTLTASDAVTVTPSDNGYIISGGSETLPTQGRTGGSYLPLGSKIETNLSGKSVKVTILASAENGPTSLFAAYSTNDVGQSRWRERTVGKDSSEVTFEYDIAMMDEGRSDYVGFYAPNEPVELLAVSVEVVE